MEDACIYYFIGVMFFSQRNFELSKKNLEESMKVFNSNNFPYSVTRLGYLLDIYTI